MEKYFIFDMDGVIIDSEPIHKRVEKEIAAEYGVHLDNNRLLMYTGMRPADMWSVIIDEENMDVNLEELLSHVEMRMVEEIKNSNLQPMEGIIPLLNYLDENQYKIALASSSPRSLINTVLSKFSIRHYYTCIVSGEVVKNGKPAPDIYFETSRQLNTEPPNCIVLEDSANGIASANAAGMTTIGYQSDLEQDLNHANLIVHRIDQVPSIL